MYSIFQKCSLHFTQFYQVTYSRLHRETWMRTNSIPSVAYPLNDSYTIIYYRFTMPYLRTWLTCRSFSLAHFHHYVVIGLTWPLSPRLSYVYLLDPSDGILEGTVPVKLPTRHCPFVQGKCVYGLLRSLTYALSATSYLWQAIYKHNAWI